MRNPPFIFRKKKKSAPTENELSNIEKATSERSANRHTERKQTNTERMETKIRRMDSISSILFPLMYIGFNVIYVILASRD